MGQSRTRIRPAGTVIASARPGSSLGSTRPRLRCLWFIRKAGTTADPAAAFLPQFLKNSIEATNRGRSVTASLSRLSSGRPPGPSQRRVTTASGVSARVALSGAGRRQRGRAVDPGLPGSGRDHLGPDGQGPTGLRGDHLRCSKGESEEAREGNQGPAGARTLTETRPHVTTAFPHPRLGALAEPIRFILPVELDGATISGLTLRIR